MTGDHLADLYPNQEVSSFERVIRFMGRHWLLWMNLLVGLYAVLPWISPLVRAWGWDFPGKAIFHLYGGFCHQHPDYSYYILGYQVAYCHRDAAIYTTMFAAGLVFGLVRRRCRPLRWWVLLLALVPLAVDGITQAPRAILPEWSLRAENHWAVVLTGGALPDWFYVGDAVGSLNWWLRTFSGALFGLALVFTLYPWVESEVRRGFAVPLAEAAPAVPRSPHGMSEGTTCPPGEPAAIGTSPPAGHGDPTRVSPDARRHKRCDAA